MTTHQGYAYAVRMDKILNEALEAYDITRPEHQDGYRSLLRTVESSLKICRREMEHER